MYLASYQHHVAGLGSAKPNPTLTFNKEIKMLKREKIFMPKLGHC